MKLWIHVGGKHVFQQVFKFMDHALKKMAAALSGRWPVLGWLCYCMAWRCRRGALLSDGRPTALPIGVPGEPEHAGGAERQRVKGAA